MPIEDIYNQSLSDAVRKGMRDGMKRALARENGVDPNNRAEMARYLAGVMREPPAYSAAEVCLHSFTHDTGVCMSCGMSEASVRLGVAKPRVSTPLPGDHVGWDKLKESLDQREPAVGKSPIERVFEDMQDLWIKQLEISTAVRAQSMTKTEAQLHHLTSVLGSREKALDAWKAAHLGARAIKNARADADHLDAVAMDRAVDELSDAQTLQHAMNVPIAAEKSMRAQLLLREDD